MIVDDGSVRRAFGMLLGAAAITPSPQASGQVFLKTTASTTKPVAWVATGLPGRDGIELLRRARLQARGRHAGRPRGKENGMAIPPRA